MELKPVFFNRFRLIVSLAIISVLIVGCGNPFQAGSVISSASTPPPVILQPTSQETTAAPVIFTVINFAVIGDFGYAGENEAGVSDLVHKMHPDFIITTGDDNYESGGADTIDENITQYYSDYIDPPGDQVIPTAINTRFFPALGNHDFRTDHGQPYFDYFKLPGNERYYSVSWDYIEIFVLNSYETEPDGFSSDSDQAMWLKKGLAESDAVWKIVSFHYPPYSSGTHGSTECMRWPFKEWGASIVLTGHDHTYERLVVDGFPYIVDGLGGKSLSHFEIILPESQVRYNDDYGALFAQANGQSITFKFINIQGTIIDEFVLTH